MKEIDGLTYHEDTYQYTHDKCGKRVVSPVDIVGTGPALFHGIHTMKACESCGVVIDTSGREKRWREIDGLEWVEEKSDGEYTQTSANNS